MGRFTIIAKDAFDALQTDAGVVLTKYDPYHPYDDPASDDILATTTGGVSPTCTPTYTDYGADVDNVPNNMMEFKRLDGWDCGLGFTSIKFNAENTKWGLGAADISTLSNGVKVIKPRMDVKLSDFKELWWVGDKANGGAYAICIKNGLSTGGLSIKTNKNGKGTNAVTVTGHVSIHAQKEVPMVFYDIPPEDEAGTAYIAQLYDEHTNSDITAEKVDIGTELSGTLSVAEGYVLSTVHITMGGTDITELDGVFDPETGAIHISKVTADVAIAATSKESV